MNYKTIFSSFATLAFGEFSSKAFGFLTTVYLARVLGVDGFGFYGFVSSVSTYFILFSNFGIEQYSTQRLSSSKPSLKDNLIGTVIGTRIILSIFFILIFIVFGFFYSKSKSELFLFTFQTIFIMAFAINLQFYFVAMKKIKILTFLKIGTSVIILLCSIIFIVNSTDLSKIILINGIVTFSISIIGVIYVFVQKDWDLKIPEASKLWTLFKSAAPLGISALMIQIYHSADVVFLGFTNPGLELGYYTGAYKIINLLSSIPGIFYLIFLPDLSRITTKYLSSQYVKQYVSIVILCGFIVTVICYIFSVQMVSLILGEAYIPAVDVYRILLINVFLIFVNVALAHLFIAWNQHKIYLVIVTSGAFVNICTNILLIPHYGILGAAIATVSAEVAVLITSIWYHHKLYNLLKFD